MVPALIFLASLCALSAAFCLALNWGLDLHDEHRQLSSWVTALGVIGAAAAILLGITAGVIEDQHWKDHCHRVGGVVGNNECVKPNSIIPID